MINLTVPRHFDRREWASIFDRLMNHESMESPIEDLVNIREYLEEEYRSLTNISRDGFRLKYNEYVLSK